jgi:hypothetical protein
VTRAFLSEGTAKLGTPVIRVAGEGLKIQDHGKTTSSTRTVRLPGWLTARLLARQVPAEGNEWDVVSPPQG